MNTSESNIATTKQDKLFPATMMPDRNWWQALWPDPDAVIKSLCIEEGMNVIDLGCGYAYFTAAISRQIGKGRVIGVDLDPNMLKQAETACEGIPNCEWVLADAMALKYVIHTAVDYILIANTFHGVPDKVALSREVATCLKSKGRFAIVNWHPLPREETKVLDQPRGPDTNMRMSVEQTCEMVEPAGFKLEKLVDLLPYHYGAIFIREK